MIGITVVGDDDYFITVGFGSFHRIFHAVVDSFDSLFDRAVDTGMADHITVGIVHHDKVKLLCPDSFHQFIFHFVSAHFRFQVVSSHFRARNQDTFFSFIRGFASAIEEESHVSVFLCLGDVELSSAAVS